MITIKTILPIRNFPLGIPTGIIQKIAFIVIILKTALRSRNPLRLPARTKSRNPQYPCDEVCSFTKLFRRISFVIRIYTTTELSFFIIKIIIGSDYLPDYQEGQPQMQLLKNILLNNFREGYLLLKSSGRISSIYFG